MPPFVLTSTSPSAGALIGVPLGAGMSIPQWNLRPLLPYPDEMLPGRGQIKLEGSATPATPGTLRRVPVGMSV